jgi:hypothetical protein
LYLVCGRKFGRVGATDRPRPYSINKTAKKSLGRRALPLTTWREPEQLPGPLRPKTRGARIRKEVPPTAKEEQKLLDPTTTAQLLAGVDVSKDRLDVSLRWSEPESHQKEEAFVVAYDDSGIDALLSPPGGAYRASGP